MRRSWNGIIGLIAIGWVLSLAGGIQARPPENGEPHASDTKPADGDASKDGDDQDSMESTLEALVEKASVTRDEVTIDGQTVFYQATAAKMLMKDEHGKLKATVFFVAYERVSSDEQEADDEAEVPEAPNDRPITFVFNGGPGAAAVWLHLGALGPRRIELTEEGHVTAPPYRAVPNASSWIDVTDLVFIDPVGTGFSRPAKGEKGEQFYGVREDIEWVADFIRLYTTRYGRWSSPMFLAGESYGTTRAAGLSEHLLDRFGIALNGVVMISSVLDFKTLSIREGNDLPYVLFLPTYTASAWYHQRLPDDLQGDLETAIQEAEDFSRGPYRLALAQGAVLDADEREVVARRLARYTGLEPEFIDDADLRIDPWSFRKRLLGDERKVIGRFDSRIVGYDPKPTEHWPRYDPSLPPYLAVYSSTFNDYIRRVLGYESVLPYEVLSDRVRPWKFGEDGRGHLFVADDLSSAMTKNPHLKVMFASGYYDLATPFAAADYTIDHLNLSPDLRANIRHHYYEGGHMMYHNHPSLAKLKRDAAAFIEAATRR